MGIGTLRRHYKSKAEPVAIEAPAPAVDVPTNEALPDDAQVSTGSAPAEPEANVQSDEGGEEKAAEAQASLPVQSQQQQQHHRGSRRHR